MIYGGLIFFLCFLCSVALFLFRMKKLCKDAFRNKIDIDDPNDEEDLEKPDELKSGRELLEK